MSNRIVFLVYLPSDQILTFFLYLFCLMQHSNVYFYLFLDEMSIFFFEEPMPGREITAFCRLWNATRAVFKRGPIAYRKVMNEWNILLPTRTQSENDGVQIDRKTGKE